MQVGYLIPILFFFLDNLIMLKNYSNHLAKHKNSLLYNHEQNTISSKYLKQEIMINILFNPFSTHPT